MNTQARDNLVGYLLNALQPEEHQEVEDSLGSDMQLRHELDLLQVGLLPLEAGAAPYAPPEGLVASTMDFIAARTQVVPASMSPVSRGERAAYGRWTLTDLSVAAGVFLAASLLFFPALNAARINAQLAVCQNNLRLIGTAATMGSELDPLREFPPIPEKGPLSSGSSYAATLVSMGLLQEDSVFVCPADERFKGGFHLPGMDEIQSATGDELRQLQQVYGGSYAQTIGHYENGQYRGTRNQRRANFAVFADAPAEGGNHSNNHGRCGHNVWLEDGRVVFWKTCTPAELNDHIYRNGDGKPAPGLHPDDSVISTELLDPAQTF